MADSTQNPPCEQSAGVITQIIVSLSSQLLPLGHGCVTFRSTQAILGSRITDGSLMFQIYHVLIQLLIPVYVTSFIT